MRSFNQSFIAIVVLLAVLVLGACQPTVQPTPTPDTAEQNKAIVRRVFEEMMKQKNLDLVDELYASGYVLHDPANPGVRGPEGFKQFLAVQFPAFPDIQWTAEDMVAEGDRVAVRWTLTGTHQGALMDIPPTGKQVTMTGISIYRIADGKIAEEWAVSDVLGMLQQLGVIPAPGPPGGQ